jgi:hypothetical protein
MKPSVVRTALDRAPEVLEREQRLLDKGHGLVEGAERIGTQMERLRAATRNGVHVNLDYTLAANLKALEIDDGPAVFERAASEERAFLGRGTFGADRHAEGIGCRNGPPLAIRGH